MSSSAREQILANLRRGASNPELAADRSRELPAFTPAPFAPGELVEQFKQELAALHVGVSGPVPPAEAAACVAALVQEKQADRVLAWADDRLPAPGVSAALQQAGIKVLCPEDYGDAATRQEIEPVKVGVSGVLAGLADTGSLVVDSGGGQARAASLVPPVHVALLSVSDLYPDLPTWMAAQGTGVLSQTANVVLITGPSKTADIELNLVVGVHGPGEVHVILVAEA